MKIAFDVNQTLIRNPNSETLINLLKSLKEAGHEILVWSTSGKDYVDKTVNRLGIKKYVDQTKDKANVKGKDLPDIAFDDLGERGASAKKAVIKV